MEVALQAEIRESLANAFMGKEFSIVPRAVARVETKYRRIVTALPHPDSVATLEKLRRFEPQSMRGQPPWCGPGRGRVRL